MIQWTSYNPYQNMPPIFCALCCISANQLAVRVLLPPDAHNPMAHRITRPGGRQLVHYANGTESYDVAHGRHHGGMAHCIVIHSSCLDVVLIRCQYIDEGRPVDVALEFNTNPIVTRNVAAALFDGFASTMDDQGFPGTFFQHTDSWFPLSWISSLPVLPSNLPKLRLLLVVPSCLAGEPGFIFGLPNELLEIIMHFCAPRDVLALRCTSVKLANLTLDESFNNRWFRKAVQDEVESAPSPGWHIDWVLYFSRVNGRIDELQKLQLIISKLDKLAKHPAFKGILRE
ncbi:hypothetical protein BC938DRAFT_481139 [Jimgerdemannia flammicorona]|uniref:F-box domain-containing protein n=1 Tax=Jimgerdemannia flammicorona TaxID=994334 RepID=A0A433QGW3_9FUNG|nr:hypothetical protein BC938DRAFT_481139 [Jimgerdemannia flammicorona]